MKNVFKFILFIIFIQKLLFSEEISLTPKNFNNEVRNTFIKLYLGTVRNWNLTLSQLAIFFEGRLDEFLNL